MQSTFGAYVILSILTVKVSVQLYKTLLLCQTLKLAVCDSNAPKGDRLQRDVYGKKVEFGTNNMDKWLNDLNSERVLK